MTFLLFCSDEVGGLPYMMADALNRNGVRTFLARVRPRCAQNSPRRPNPPRPAEAWDLSSRLDGLCFHNRRVCQVLAAIKAELGITHCLATGAKAYLLRDAGMAYHYWVYGSDLDEDCLVSTWRRRRTFLRSVGSFAYHCLVHMHEMRRSLRYADAVQISHYQKPLLDRIAPGKPLFFLPHCLGVAEPAALGCQKADARERLCRELDATGFFFSSTRHCWQGIYRRLADYKGNDLVIEAFAGFTRRWPELRVKLVLVDKGPDVSASKALVARLGVGAAVAWRAEMPRAELWPYYQGALLAFGQFGTPVITLSAMEPMAHGTPACSWYGPPPEGIPFYPSLPPIINVRTVEDITAAMLRVAGSPEAGDRLGAQSHAWVREHCSEARYADLFPRVFDGIARCP